MKRFGTSILLGTLLLASRATAQVDAPPPSPPEDGVPATPAQSAAAAPATPPSAAPPVAPARAAAPAQPGYAPAPAPAGSAPTYAQPGYAPSEPAMQPMQQPPPSADTTGTWGVPQQDSEASSWSLGLKAGLLAAGSMYVEEVDTDVDTNPGPMFLASFDAMVASKLSLGAFLLHARPSVTVFDEDYDMTVTTIGGTIKGRFGAPDAFQIRPGMAFGYQLMSADDAGEVGEDIKGFDVGALVELSIPTGSLRVPIELGFISQPAGGNDFSEITFSPIFYLTAGIEFGG